MVSERFVDLLHNISFKDISADVFERAKIHLLDFMGVTLAGLSFDNNNEKVFKTVSSISGTGESTLIGKNEKLSASFAALYNSCLNHTIEMDDTHSAASLHPASVIISAALAVGEEVRCSGIELLFSIIIGYEVMIRLGKAVNPEAHYRHGFHPTATCGTFGSAMVAAKLLKLDREALKNAFGLAGSYTSGNCKYQTEASLAKRLQPGIATQGGITSALFAKEGIIGPHSILDDYNGFLKSHSDNSDEAILFEDIGQPYEIMNTGIKFYPCCRYNHASIDGILGLIEKHNIDTTQIKKIWIEVPKAAIPIVVEPMAVKTNPQNLLDGQFSLYFSVALATVKSKLSFDDFTVDMLADERLKDIISITEIRHNPELDKLYPQFWAANVTVEMKNNEQYTSFVKSCKGEPDTLSKQEVEQKYLHLACKAISREQAMGLKDKIENIMDADDIRGLLDKLFI